MNFRNYRGKPNPDEVKYGGFYLCGNCQRPVKNGEVCSNCKPGEPQTYHLNCVKCGSPYRSTDAFPEPQVCLDCKPRESLLSDIPDLRIEFAGDALDYMFNKLRLEPDAEKKIKEWVQQIRADERAKCDKEKAEFGLSVHEAARALTLKEVYQDVIKISKGAGNSKQFHRMTLCWLRRLSMSDTEWRKYKDSKERAASDIGDTDYCEQEYPSCSYEELK